MPRISNIALLKTVEQPALSIRTRTNVNKLPATIRQGYGQLENYLARLGEHLSGKPFVAYYNMDMSDLDVELGFPVDTPLPPSGDILYTSVPGGLNVFCMYLGPYGQIAPVYDEIAAWITANGHTAAGTAYQLHYNGLDCPEDQLLTQIVMPLL